MAAFDPTCADFRAHLSAALERGGVELTSGGAGGRPLAWHEHLFACADCREILAGEEALEALLQSLPEPRLPVALARRVLTRLAAAPDTTGTYAHLDDLLEAGGAAEVPADLASRVLAGLAAAAPAGSIDPLDHLLERLPEPEAPAGLADRVLEAARLDRLLDEVPAPQVPVGLEARVMQRTVGIVDTVGTGTRRTAAAPRPLLRWLAPAAAAAVLLVVGGRFLVGSDEPVRPGIPGEGNRVAENDPPIDDGLPGLPEGGELVASVPPEDLEGSAPEHPTLPEDPGTTLVAAAPEPELLDSLDLLEDWELLMADDLDLLLGSLDEVDQELLLLAAADEEQG